MTTAPLIGIARHRIKVDGHGVTTLVAFHGCPLRCKYCLNSQCLRKDGVWKEFTAQQVYDYVKKDEIYFLATNGGICFGGGEPCLRVEFIKEFRSLCGNKWTITIESSLNNAMQSLLFPNLLKWGFSKATVPISSALDTRVKPPKVHTVWCQCFRPKVQNIVPICSGLQEQDDGRSGSGVPLT